MSNPSCIGLIITNRSHSRQNMSTISTGLSSDFHKLVWTVLKTLLRKTAPEELHYRDYNKFNAEGFKPELKQKLVTNNSNYENFEPSFSALLDKYTPCKSQKIRAN